ncbi:MAG: HlyD family secretion protein [Bdellovibrionota bacterium]
MNAASTKKKLNITRKHVLTGVGSLVAVLGCYLAYQHFMFISTDNAQVEAHSVMLASKVAGFVVEVKVTEGQRVKTGDVLVQIDPRDYENTLTQIKGDLTSAEARKRDVERNYGRISSLFSQGAVSQQQFDTASTSYSEAKAKFEAVSAQVAQAQLNLDNTRVVAPIDGFIARKAVEKGQLTSPGIPLIGFIGADERWITANFKETEISQVKVGAKVDVTVDAADGEDYHGTVESISSATGSTFTLLPPDNATGNFTKVVQRVPVKIKLEGLKDSDFVLLKAGLSAVVKVHK